MYPKHILQSLFDISSCCKLIINEFCNTDKQITLDNNAGSRHTKLGLKIHIILLIITINTTLVKSQTISGYISNAQSGEVLIGANIHLPNSQQTSTTNDYGFFSMKLSSDDACIIASYVGYKDDTLYIQDSMQELKIALSKKNVELEGVVVSAQSSNALINDNQLAGRRLSIESIKEMPMIFGEADVIKAIQLQPGVKTTGEGSSGMFVRGGSSDQNLILIDEAPIYNVSHLWGYLSVFNPDAVNSALFYKSNMPAEYGGRCAAVLDCKMKEGNMWSHHFSAGISTLNASLYANGPIVKGKSSYLFSVRKSTPDLLFPPKQEGMFNIVPGFHDFNIKLNTKLGEKARLYFSLYHTKDYYKSYDSFDNQWKNTVASLRWNRSIGQKWYSNVSLISSKYVNDIKYKEESQDYNWGNGIEDLNLKIDFDYHLSSTNRIELGTNLIYHQFTPGESSNSQNSIPGIQSIESAVYALQDVTLWDKLGLNYGLRLSLFQNLGNTVWYEYDNNLSPIEHQNNGGVYNYSFNPEPRVSLSYKASPSLAIKGGYARNAQYMQVLQNSTESYTSLETWFPANANIKPLLSDVVSAGWFQELTPSYFCSVELYYKNIYNVIDYKDHAQLTDNPYIEAEIKEGDARSYGLEVEVKKQQGKITGSVSYNYSRALQTIEGINSGLEYSSLHDIPHDVRIIGNYQHNNKWSFSGFWIFASGRPVTTPIGFYADGHMSIPIYPERNSSRFPNYHRLDLSAQYTTKAKHEKSYWEIGFGVFNAYAKENTVAYIYEGANLKPQSSLGFFPNFSFKIYY